MSLESDVSVCVGRLADARKKLERLSGQGKQGMYLTDGPPSHEGRDSESALKAARRRLGDVQQDAENLYGRLARELKNCRHDADVNERAARDRVQSPAMYRDFTAMARKYRSEAALREQCLQSLGEALGRPGGVSEDRYAVHSTLNEGLETLTDDSETSTEPVDIPEYELFIEPRYTVDYQIANGQARWKKSRIDAFDEDAGEYRAWKARTLPHRFGEEFLGASEPTLYEKLLAGKPLPPKYESRPIPGGHHCLPDVRECYVV